MSFIAPRFTRLALIGAALLVAATATNAAEIRVSVGSAEGSPGQELAIPISVKGAENFAALQMRFSYDPAVLKPKATAPDDAGTIRAEVENGPLLKGAVVTSEIGEGGMGLGLVTTEFIQGDGVILKPMFVVQGLPGQKSPLKLESVRAWEGKNYQEFIVATDAGEFVVGSSGSPFPWLYVGLGCIAVVVLLVAVLVARRKPAENGSASARRR